MCEMSLDEIRAVVGAGNAMTAGEWMGKKNPPKVWIYGGKGPTPDKHQYVPGTKPGPNGIQLLPANDGTYVPELTDHNLEQLVVPDDPKRT